MMSELVDVFWHEHRVRKKLYSFGNRSCQGCLGSLGDNSIYICIRCKLEWHFTCVPSSPDDIKHPFHPSHPLELLVKGPPNYSDGNCNLCQRKLSNITYHCKLCDFSLDMKCMMDPPPLIVSQSKCHEHALTLMVREVSFKCNACGTHGEGSPYVCLPCSFMFHYDCIDRPHVININRHDHRVSHVRRLSIGIRVCEICRQDINWRYGVYSCNKCPDYFVHTKCATRQDVWDGVELEGIDEEEPDAPFKMIDEGLINHFSHEQHNLLLIEDVIVDGGGEGIHCEACSHPISFERYYKCMECDFMLHEECANLPLQKRHALSTRILSLSTGKKTDNIVFVCNACCRSGTGFRYEDGADIVLDVHCASLSWFRHRKLHPHTLFLTTIDRGTCVSCDQTDTRVLSCVDCEYFLDFECATLPLVIKHRCDDHYLFLSSGEKATGKYWCEICEAETHPNKWFYTCHNCGVVCHINCVVGDSLNIKPGISWMMKEMRIVAVLNDRNSRPRCCGCGTRCRWPMVYNLSPKTRTAGIYCCSLDCIKKHISLISFLFS